MREIGKQLCMKLIICRGLMVVRRIELCSSPLDFLGLQDYLLVDVHVLVIYSPPSCEVLMTVICWWHLLMSSHLSKLCKQLLILCAVLKADSRTQHNCQKLIVQQHGEHIMVLYNNFINKEKTKPGQTEKHTHTRTHACWFVFFCWFSFLGNMFLIMLFFLCVFIFWVKKHFLCSRWSLKPRNPHKSTWEQPLAVGSALEERSCQNKTRACSTTRAHDFENACKC